jgi:hypothetical protein
LVITLHRLLLGIIIRSYHFHSFFCCVVDTMSETGSRISKTKSASRKSFTSEDGGSDMQSVVSEAFNDEVFIHDGFVTKKF